jgi:hypothetical protein
MVWSNLPPSAGKATISYYKPTVSIKEKQSMDMLVIIYLHAILILITSFIFAQKGDAFHEIGRTLVMIL